MLAIAKIAAKGRGTPLQHGRCRLDVGRGNPIAGKGRVGAESGREL